MRSDEKESQRSGVTGLPAFLKAERREDEIYVSENDVDISYNRVIIDAKSILGILSMDLTKVLTVTCHGEDHEFNRFLQKFAVA